MMRMRLDLPVTARAIGSDFLAKSRGYALMAALLALVVVSLAAAVALNRARLDGQRERESQLLWVGNQYRQALYRYHALTPPDGKSQYPQRLADLLEDQRFLSRVRHLRQLYVDPFTGKSDWVFELEGDRIVGLHSRSAEAPVRRSNLGPGNDGFSGAKTYADWRFLAVDAPAVAGAAPNSAQPGLAADALGPIAPSTQGGGPGDASSGAPATNALADPTAAARSACNAQYGVPSISCRGPNFPAGTDGPSCRQAFAKALDECLAASGN